MSYKSRWDNGGWNTICDVCGRKFKNSDLQLRWDGLMTCSADWEIRQPQDFVRGVADIQTPPFTRPESSDYFVPLSYTQQPDESVDVTEVLVKAVVKYLGGSGFDSRSALNGAVINAIALNATTKYTDLEAVEITELVLIELGRVLSDTVTPTEAVAKTTTKQLSDSLALSESLQLIETETLVESLSASESNVFLVGKNVAETISLTESVSNLLISPTALNGAAINSLGLD